MRKTSWHIVAIFVIAFIFSPIRICAQEFRATLSGIVDDPSGAAIPGASVTAVENDTGLAYNAKTDAAGKYYIPYVLPGIYKMSVTSTGFQNFQEDNVTVTTAQSQGLNFNLQVASVSTQVTVTSAPPLLDTTSASGGAVLTTQEIESLPLNGRQIYMLLATTPGTQFLQTQFGASGYSGTRGWDVSNNYSIGGGVQGYQNFLLNGTSITIMTGFGAQGTWMVAPNADAIQETNVVTIPYDARYGDTLGGVVNIATKSGTNGFHGDLYEYLENGAFNANNFESNFNDLPRQNTIQHQYGGTFGGPIVKNKAFFFGSFEGYWENIPFTILASVPPAYLRFAPGSSGVDFTPSGYTIYDPLTTVCNAPGGTLGNCPGNNFSRTEFPNDTIPAGRINTAGAALLNLFPAPNTNANSITNNYIASAPDKYRYYQPMLRLDWVTGPGTHWYGMFEYQRGTEFRNSSGFTGPAENGDINTFRSNIVGSIDMSHVFSNTMDGDFKLSFTRYHDDFPDGPLATPTPSSIGLNMPTIPTATKQLLPEITFSELYPQVVGNSVSQDVDQAEDVDVDFTKTFGRHTFQFGSEIGRWNFGNPGSVGHPNGTFSFGTSPTQLNPTNRGNNDGNVIASLLLGDPTGGGVDWNSTDYETIVHYSVYAQDNWHVSRKLSLNLGLRYDIEAGPIERYNHLNRGMCLTCVNPITSNSVYQTNIANASNNAAWQAAYSTLGTSAPNLSTVYGGIQFAGVNGQPRDAYDVDWTVLSPRLGFAYAFNDKTVLRAGWGWVAGYGIEAGTSDGFSISTPYITSLNGGATPTSYFQSGAPYPSGAEAPLGASAGLLTGVGNTAQLDFPQRKIPRATIISAGISRTLPWETVLNVRYVGNHARDLRTQGVFTWINGTLPLDFGYYPDLQQSDYNATFASEINAQLPNPYYGVLPSNTSMGSSPTTSAVNLLVPYSQFGLVGNYTKPFGKSQFDALEVEAKKRLYGAKHGADFTVAYTHSRNEEQTHYLNGWPWQDAHPLNERIAYDRPNTLAISWAWDLPWGEGARYVLPHPNRWLGELVSDWRLSGVFTMESGEPEGLPGGRWFTSSHSFAPDGGQNPAQWIYNCNGQPSSCWESIPSRGQGNLPDRIGYIRQPSTPNLDLSLQKDFPITESKKLALRADAFNATNSVLFGGPDLNPNDCISGQAGCKTAFLAHGWAQGFGTIAPFQDNFPRIVQLSLKLFF
jgi:hypothetical protein